MIVCKTLTLNLFPRFVDFPQSVSKFIGFVTQFLPLLVQEAETFQNRYNFAFKESLTNKATGDKSGSDSRTTNHYFIAQSKLSQPNDYPPDGFIIRNYQIETYSVL